MLALLRGVYLAGRVDVIGVQNDAQVMILPTVAALADAAAARTAIPTVDHHYFEERTEGVSSRGSCPFKTDEEGKGEYPLLSLSEYSAPGACGKARVVLQHCEVDMGGGDPLKAHKRAQPRAVLRESEISSLIVTSLATVLMFRTVAKPSIFGSFNFDRPMPSG